MGEGDVEGTAYLAVPSAVRWWMSLLLCSCASVAFLVRLALEPPWQSVSL